MGLYSNRRKNVRITLYNTYIKSSRRKLHFYFYFNSGRQLQMHKRINRLIGRIDDINQSFVSFQPKMLTCVLVDKGGFVDHKHFSLGRQWNRTRRLRRLFVSRYQPASDTYRQLNDNHMPLILSESSLLTYL